MHYIERLKTFLLALTMLPTVVMAQVAEDGYDGAVDGGGWGVWGWFWVILLLAIVAVAVYYAMRAGGVRRGPAARGGRGPTVP